jgi:hypothetical protein
LPRPSNGRSGALHRLVPSSSILVFTSSNILSHHSCIFMALSLLLAG